MTQHGTAGKCGAGRGVVLEKGLVIGSCASHVPPLRPGFHPERSLRAGPTESRSAFSDHQRPIESSHMSGRHCSSPAQTASPKLGLLLVPEASQSQHLNTSSRVRAESQKTSQIDFHAPFLGTVAHLNTTSSQRQLIGNQPVRPLE